MLPKKAPRSEVDDVYSEPADSANPRMRLNGNARASELRHLGRREIHTFHAAEYWRFDTAASTDEGRH